MRTPAAFSASAAASTTSSPSCELLSAVRIKIFSASGRMVGTIESRVWVRTLPVAEGWLLTYCAFCNLLTTESM